MKKTKNVNVNFDALPQAEKDILKNAAHGAAFDAVGTKETKESKKAKDLKIQSGINIASQNADTGLPYYNSDDTRPYEQKNLSSGFHKSGNESK